MFQEFQQGQPASYRAWCKWYRGNPEIVGSTLRIEDRPFTIVGVEPEGYSGLIIDEPQM